MSLLRRVPRISLPAPIAFFPALRLAQSPAAPYSSPHSSHPLPLAPRLRYSLFDSRTSSPLPSSAWPGQRNARRTLFIQTSSTPNPNSVRFTPTGKTVMGTAESRDFQSFKQAQSSPLALRLFKVEGVTGCYFGPDWLTVNVKDGMDWSTVQPEIFAAITDFYTSGEPIVHAADAAGGAAQTPNPNAILDTDDEVVATIKELLETRVRPAVMEDGGDVIYRGFKDGVVYLQMQGSCVGCPSSSVTLKSGIEQMLKHYVDEVSSVEEWVDAELEAVSSSALSRLEQALDETKQGPTGGPNAPKATVTAAATAAAVAVAVAADELLAEELDSPRSGAAEFDVLLHPYTEDERMMFTTELLTSELPHADEELEALNMIAVAKMEEALHTGFAAAATAAANAPAPPTPAFDDDQWVEDEQLEAMSIAALARLDRALSDSQESLRMYEDHQHHHGGSSGGVASEQPVDEQLESVSLSVLSRLERSLTSGAK